MSQTSALPAEVIEAVLTNPKIRKRAERTIARLFDEIDDTLEWGTAGERAGLMRTVMPALLRGVQSAQQDAERDRQRAEYQELREMMQGLGAKPPADD